jgi:2-oxoglutarate dehydrogenase E2 component (dihydrolipoamide succinyltransferase)
MLKFTKLARLAQPSALHLRNPRFAFTIKKQTLPSIAESIKDVTVVQYLKQEGEFVNQDDEILEVETHKGNFKVRSSAQGQVVKFLVAPEQDIEIGAEYVEIDTDATQGNAPVQKKEEAPAAPQQPAPKAESEKVEKPKETKPAPPKEEAKKSAPVSVPTSQATGKVGVQGFVRTETVEKMTRLRRTVSDRLKQSQNTYAQVTTFQEVDMSEIMKIRKELGDEFLKRNGVKLGLMSFFVKAVARALQERPIVNSVIAENGSEIIHRNYVDISVAVSSPKGLVVPIIRNVQTKTFAQVEQTLSDLAQKAANNQLALEDMEGGTFTISNGGVFGSMLSAPIINPPQSAILGMHNIVNRPVVRGDQIVARPIMYLSMSYDHRLLDGREGAGFLKRVSDLLDDPRKLLLEF